MMTMVIDNVAVDEMEYFVVTTVKGNIGGLVGSDEDCDGVLVVVINGMFQVFFSRCLLGIGV